jgi:hypothetical protein
MITLSVLIAIWGCISIYRIHKVCKEQDIPFNPFEVSTESDYLGVILFLAGGITVLILAILIYLP